jgi:hypothetical protein
VIPVSKSCSRFLSVTKETFVQGLALRMLAGEGMSGIWQLHVAAASAHRCGRSGLAVMLIEIADAAERECPSVSIGENPWK